MTLIELLAVVLVIGMLAGLLMPALQRARNKSRRVRAQGETRELVKAWNAFWYTYTNLPFASVGTTVIMDGDMVKILQGDDAEWNPLKVKFMDFPPEAEVNGFKDPWGQVYRVQLQSSGNVPNVWTFSTRAYCVHRKRND